MPHVRRAVVACASLSLAVVLLGLVPGCDLFGSSGATGSVTLRVTDAPFPVDLISEATVTITRIELRKADPAEQQTPEPEDAESEPADDSGDPTAASRAQAPAAQDLEDPVEEDGDDPEDVEDPADDAETTAEDSEEWITIFEGQKEFNLLDLRNGRTDLLAEVEVPAGTYTQMRLVVPEGSITLKDGRTFTLKVPSGGQTGIKLHFTFTIEEDEAQSLLLDVDLSRAFKPIPGSGTKRPEDITSFKFQPSLAMRLINVVQAGSISGMVTDVTSPLAGVNVTAQRDGLDVTSTSTEADGTYTLSGLPAGTYSVVFSAEGFLDQTIADVEVVAEQTTESVNAMLEGAPPEEPAL